MEVLRELEIMLHQYEIRKDINQLKKLLHPEFVEIGYSGKTIDFDSTIKEVPLEAKPDYQVWSQDYQYIKLAEDVIQLIYLEARMDIEGKLSRHAKRTSIWVNNHDQWQMRFHQGTATAPFEQTTN